ncbi:MAG: hypothetical protein AAF804_07340 [Bacteroidota bacterium]
MRAIYQHEFLLIDNGQPEPQTYHFLSFQWEYNLEAAFNRPFTLAIHARNLGNTLTFGQNSINDLLVISNQVQLRPRSVMAEVTFKF